MTIYDIILLSPRGAMYTCTGCILYYQHCIHVRHMSEGHARGMYPRTSSTRSCNLTSATSKQQLSASVTIPPLIIDVSERYFSSIVHWPTVLVSYICRSLAHAYRALGSFSTLSSTKMLPNYRMTYRMTPYWSTETGRAKERPTRALIRQQPHD